LRLTTLADVRDFLKHIPKERLKFATWQCFKSKLDGAAVGADPREASVALRLVLMFGKRRVHTK
jgi:hypothetical protein